MLQRRKAYGETVSAHGVRVTPESESLGHKSRFFTAIWNRPTGVIVHAGERIYRIPIVDRTRLVQFLLLLIAAMSMAVVGIEMIKERRE